MNWRNKVVVAETRCPTCGCKQDSNDVRFKFDVYDKVHTWNWIRVKLPRGVETFANIKIESTTASRKDLIDGRPYIREWNANYPVDSSFVQGESLSAPCHLGIYGVTFMMSCQNDYEDSDSLRDNYIYRLWVSEKWFHQGPMRLFPLVTETDTLENRHIPKDTGLPWLDEWDEPLVLPPQVKLGICLEGIPFTPMADMDFIIGIVGDYVRSVQ